jgi:hypothetical protein
MLDEVSAPPVAQPRSPIPAVLEAFRTPFLTKEEGQELRRDLQWLDNLGKVEDDERAIHARLSR